MTVNDDPQFRMAIIAMANDVLALLDGTTKPIKKIIDANDLVMGVFPDLNSEDGVGLLIIKGEKRLEAIAGRTGAPFAGAIPLFSPSAPEHLKVGAIPCESYEQAVAARRVFGDARP